MSTEREWAFHQTWIGMARTVAKLSTCTKAQVGAVLVKDNRLVAMGFNGSPKGTMHCTEVGCYEDKGHCVRTVHAEQNAVVHAAVHGLCTDGSILYSTHRPCLACTKILINAGIQQIYYVERYDAHPLAYELLGQAGISIQPFHKLLETL